MEAKHLPETPAVSEEYIMLSNTPISWAFLPGNSISLASFSEKSAVNIFSNTGDHIERMLLWTWNLVPSTDSTYITEVTRSREIWIVIHWSLHLLAQTVDKTSNDFIIKPRQWKGLMVRMLGFHVAVSNPGGGGVLPQILDRGVLRRFVNPNPI